MEGFGAYLKREREMRAVTLREVAQATRISEQALQALEEERFEELQAEVFIRGFLRGYARYLGLNVEDILLRYEECRRPAQAEPRDTQGKTAAYWPWGASLGAVLVFLGLWAFLGQTDKPAEPLPVPAALPVEAVVEPMPAAAEATAPVEVEAPAPAAEPAHRPVDLRIRAERTSYIKLWIDEDRPLERELQPGAEWTVTADERIEVLLGNAGGVVLLLNGEELPRLGPEGRVRRRVITAEGVFTP